MAEDDIAARLARLEQTVAEERRARLAAEIRLDGVLRQLSQAVAAAQANLTQAITAEQAERERLTTQQEADRKWLAALAEHVTVAQQETHDWFAAEVAARLALEAGVAAAQAVQVAITGAAKDRFHAESALRAEVLALSHIVEDLATAVFPTAERG